MTSSSRNSTTLSIRGRDDTGKAFASVKRGLGTLPPAAKRSSKGIGDAFGKLPPQLQGVGKALRGVGAVLSGPLGITLGAGAAATALGAFARASINAADELGKAATRTGVSVEALSSLEVAARQGGTSFSALERGLVKLSRNAVDAADGLGEASRGFDRLGISVTDANGQVRDTDTLYAEVAEELSEMEAGTRKTAIAQEIFGRGGAALIPVLNSGAEAMGNNVTTSEKLARSSEALNDRMDDIRVIVGQVGNAILKGVVPPLADFLTSVVDGARDLKTRFGPALSGINKVLGEVGRVAVILARHIGSNLLGVFKAAGQFLKVVFTPAINLLRKGFGGLGKDAPRLSGALRGLAAWFVRVSGKVTELTQYVLGGASAALSFSQTLAAIVRLDFRGARRAYEGIGEAWETASKNAAATRQRTNEAANAILNKAVPAAEDFEKELGGAVTTSGEIGDEFTTTSTNIGTAKGDVETFETTAKAAQEAIGQAELDRFTQYNTNLDNTRIIEQNNHAAAKGRADELHTKRLGHLDLETARQINADVDVFTRRTALIQQQREVQEKAADNYKKKIQEQTAEAEKHRVKWEEVGTTLRNSVQTAIQGLITGTQSWGKALSNIANSILNNIISKFAQLATNSIFNLFTGGGGGLGSLFRAGAGAAAGAAGKALAGGAAGLGGAGAGVGKALGGIGKAAGAAAKALGPLAAIAAPVALFGFLGRDRESATDRAQKRTRSLLSEARAGNLDRDFTSQEVTDLSRLVFNARRAAARPDRKDDTLRDAGLLEQFDRIGRSRSKIIRRKQDRERKELLDRATALAARKTFEFFDEDQLRQIGLRDGGIVRAQRGGRLSVIGEGGLNEAVVPLPNGRSIPVEIQNGGNLGSRTVNITVNVEGGGDGGGIGQRIEDALLRAIEPGGVLAGVA